MTPASRWLMSAAFDWHGFWASPRVWLVVQLVVVLLVLVKAIAVIRKTRRELTRVRELLLDRAKDGDGESPVMAGILAEAGKAPAGGNGSPHPASGAEAVPPAEPAGTPDASDPDRPEQGA